MGRKRQGPQAQGQGQSQRKQLQTPRGGPLPKGPEPVQAEGHQPRQVPQEPWLLEPVDLHPQRLLKRVKTWLLVPLPSQSQALVLTQLRKLQR